jgi:tRNA(Ile)-lysidine synthetase-like protein
MRPVIRVGGSPGFAGAGRWSDGPLRGRTPHTVRGTHPERRLERHLAETLRPSRGETLLVAASGGPDSGALAALATEASRRVGARVVLGHVNHGVRAGAWQDEAVVLALGAALGARVLRAGLEAGSSDEATLRKLRYAALATMAREAGARRVCTAHHAEDQTETVLLALFRGAGPDGLRGMAASRPLDDGLSLERPLLRVPAAELRDHCLRRLLPYARDASNADPSYRRNAVRAALAELRRSFPRLDEAVARCAVIAAEGASGRARGRARALLRDALEEGSGLNDLTFERLDAAARLIERGTTGRVFLRRGVELEIRAT